jgi:hypothetical protein
LEVFFVYQKIIQIRRWILISLRTKKIKFSLSKKTALPMKIQCLIFVLLISYQLFGQGVVKGRVFDAKNNEIMPFASVYISNSAKGSQSDINGNYQLNNLPLGNVQLVVSFVGYHTFQQNIKVEDGKTLEINIHLIPQTNVLSEVEIKAKRDKVWEKRLREFRKMFLGESQNALDSKILNEWVLDFDLTSNGIFKANALQPLEIENRGLGYKLFYDLQNFSRTSDNNVVFLGTSRFVELSPKDLKEFKKWESNRFELYQRSPERFMRSLYNGTLSKDGYLVYQMERADEWFSASTNYQKPHNIIDETNGIEKVMTSGKDGEKILKLALPLEITMMKFNYNNVARLRMRTTDVGILADGWINNPIALEMGSIWSKHRIGDMLPREYGSSDEETLSTNSSNDFNRIYLHTNKEGYVVNEKIWFSAYLTNSYKRLARKVMPMYVQLHNATGGVVNEQIIFTSNGRGVGYMPALDSLSSGVYRLRAYTREMLNIPQTIFEKEIVIQNPVSEYMVTQKVKTLEGEPNEKLTIKIESDKEVYKPNEKITIKLNCTNAYNEKTAGTFSVSVNDINRQISDNEEFTIKSYSAKAFKNPKNNGNKFAYEPNISISGVVRNEFTKRLIPRSKLDFIFTNTNISKTKSVETDGKGRFRISDLDFEGENLLSYQVNDKKNRPYPDGEVVMDRLLIPVRLNPLTFEKTAVSPEKQKEWSWASQHPDGDMKTIISKVSKEMPNQKTEEDQSMNFGITKAFSSPDYSVKFDRQMNFINAYEMLQGQLQGVMVTKDAGGNYKIMVRGFNTINDSSPLLMVDGFEAQDVYWLNPNDVAKIDLFSGTNATIFGSRGGNGVIVYYTRKYGENRSGLKSAKTVFVKGYQKEIPFYMPDYQVPTNKKKVDKRTTIYWNPEVLIEANGEKTLTFYAADLPSTYKIVVEGMNVNGQVGRSEVTVVVK